MHNVNIDKPTIVSSIIDKLLPSQKYLKHNLEHKKEEHSLEELANSLQIKGEFCKQGNTKLLSSANLMENGHSKKRKLDKKKDYEKKKPLCWDYGSPCYLKPNCPNPKKKKKMGPKKSKSKGKENFAAMIF